MTEHVMNFNTEYMPSLSTEIEIKREIDKPVSFLIVEFDTREESKDPNITIVEDTEYNRECIKTLHGKIIGNGTSNIALSYLIYGLQRPTRLFYKDTISGINEFIEKYLKDKFTADDAQLRETLNTIS